MNLSSPFKRRYASAESSIKGNPVSTYLPAVAVADGTRRSGALLSPFRLKSTLTIFIVVLLAAVSGVTIVLLSRIFDRFATTVRDDLAWKAVSGAREIAQAADLGMAVADEKLIREAFHDYVNNPDVAAIVVTDAKGVRLAGHGEIPRDTAALFAGPEGGLADLGGNLVSWTSSRIEGSSVGRVALVISGKRLAEGRVLRQRMLLVLAAATVAALFGSLFFVNLYLGPLVRLTEATLRSLRDLTSTLERRVFDRTAELQLANGRLLESFDKVSSMQRQLIDTSRRAGMADVATTVLHNVGNVLTSVNVSANVVMDTVQQSRLAGLGKAVELLRGHRDDLASFLTDDPKGKRLPAYFESLSVAAGEEHQQILTELKALQKNIDHIKIIVSRQQSQAKNAVGVIETLSVADLLEEAIKFNWAAYERHRIKVVRQFESLPAVAVDRHKMFQILMNLMSNARHALKGIDGERLVTIRLTGKPDSRFAVDVEDNGCGIAPETMARIFNYGFTTKQEGHGFGLHASACAATEMGGLLTAHSDGNGQGARFTLELPCDPPEAKEDSGQIDVPAVG